jgi:acetyl-CoA synthetase
VSYRLVVVVTPLVLSVLRWDASVADPEAYWAERAKEFEWKEPWNSVLEYNFHVSKGKIFCKWFDGGVTNICHNAIDVHLATKSADPCLIFAGNDGETGTLTWGEVHQEVCRFANVLKSKGVKKGDRVALYLPMGTQLPIGMLACARIGAVHSVVFGGFSVRHPHASGSCGRSVPDRPVDRPKPWPSASW